MPQNFPQVDNFWLQNRANFYILKSASWFEIGDGAGKKERILGPPTERTDGNGRGRTSHGQRSGDSPQPPRRACGFSDPPPPNAPGHDPGAIGRVAGPD